MMTSDVRDVLNLPEGVGGPRMSKKQKTFVPKPNIKGLAREVHNLGGDNPIAIVPRAISQFKRRRPSDRKLAARWEMRPFRNSGREDQSLILRHWRRKDPKAGKDANQSQESGDDAGAQKDEIEDSAFAKYNVRVAVPRYSTDDYRQLLQSDDWTRGETDYLMTLAADFDLRWPIIWDRYEWNPPATNGETDADGDESKAVVPAVRSRSIEELKGRYYEVTSKMMAAQKPVQYMDQQEFALHELMAHFNPQQEKARKEFALNALSRSREETREEESLLLEIRRIMARSERFNEERRELYNRLDYPRAETDISAFKSSSGLQTLLKTLMNTDKSKKRKSIMGTADGTSLGSAAAPHNGAQESGKRDNAAGPLSGGHRDPMGSVATPTGGNKKTQQQHAQAEPQPVQERRKLGPEEEIIYGVTHHDRLGSGPTFRSENMNKLFTHKSNQQQARIHNALNELDVPPKLAMATAATTQQYGQLMAAVNALLETRKLSDKLDAEIKVERAKKEEREKAPARPGGENELAAQNIMARGDGHGGTRGNEASGVSDAVTPTAAATGATASATLGALSVLPGAAAAAAAAVEQATKDDEREPEAQAPASSAVESHEKRQDSGNRAETEGEDGTGRRTETEQKKGGVSRKRSASVLSDKSTKRQRT